MPINSSANSMRINNTTISAGPTNKASTNIASIKSHPISSQYAQNIEDQRSGEMNVSKLEENKNYSIPMIDELKLIGIAS